MVNRIAVVLLGLLFVCTAANAASGPVYTITYTISPAPDSSALWNVEYRALLPTQEDIAAFERDINDPQVLPPLEVQQLMERSASVASVATGRSMEIRNFSSTSSVQATPTGTYGVIQYTFLWTGFSMAGGKMEIGDAFFGGLYLSRETTLIFRLPQGYTVYSVSPPADRTNGDLTWYGLRSFSAGEPRIVLQPPAFPWSQLILVVCVLVAGAAAGAWFMLRKTGEKGEVAAITDTPAGDPLVTEAELASLEERIIKLLRDNAGALYQSEIARRLEAPKSTVSSALNGLHAKGLIQKVRKGRENLIRLV
jgi:hypothetical protein